MDLMVELIRSWRRKLSRDVWDWKHKKINNSLLLRLIFVLFHPLPLPPLLPFSCLLCYYISVNANKINTCCCQVDGWKTKLEFWSETFLTIQQLLLSINYRCKIESSFSCLGKVGKFCSADDCQTTVWEPLTSFSHIKSCWVETVQQLTVFT